MKRKKRFLLATLLFGAVLGIGLGIGTLLPQKMAQNSPNGEILLNVAEDDEELEQFSELMFEDDIIIDENELLPTAPIDAQHQNTNPKSSDETVVALQNTPKEESTNNTKEKEQKPQPVTKPKPQASTTVAQKDEKIDKVEVAQNEQVKDNANKNEESKPANTNSSSDDKNKDQVATIKVTPEMVASDYQKRLPIKVGKYQTLTDFTYSKKNGFTYVIKTTREDLTEKMQNKLVDLACENKQVQIFMQYADKVNFKFVSARNTTVANVAVPKASCAAQLEDL